ncbi:MAG: DNA primase [Christensenellaceae bacterium]|nr:DNA primase [Christensenellaceae bacterium]
MAYRFPPDWLEELRQRADIVQVVSGYVNLKQTGTRFVGLCPFHNETAPSFSVDSQKQLYYCFGCKAGGTVFDFIKDIEHLKFQEAVTYLADRVNMPLPEMANDNEYYERRSKRERIYLANKAAALIYHKTLWEPEGAKVLEYFKSRGLDDRTITMFGLGAAPNNNILISHLKNEGFNESELLEANLISNKKGKYFDVFRNRALFPIIDLYGNVLGFGGRALNDSLPKYLNTSETLAFNKRKTVYAANLLRKQKGLNRVLLVEGYMDVIALTQYGLNGVVATLGTALTKEQAQLMGRFAPEIHICFDGDDAGQNAIDKAIKIFDDAKITTRILVVPDKMDPDDYIRKFGKDKFNAIKTMNTITYRVKRAKKGLDMSVDEVRVNYAKKCSEILAELDDPVEIESQIKNIMIETGFSREVLLAQIAVEKPGIHKAFIKKEIDKKRTISKNTTKDIDIPAAEQLLLAVLMSKKLPFDTFDENLFSSELLKNTFKEIQNNKSAALILDETTKEEDLTVLNRIFATVVPDEVNELMQMAQDCVIKIKRQKLSDELKKMQENLNNLPQEKQVEEMYKATKILEQLKKLT